MYNGKFPRKKCVKSLFSKYNSCGHTTDFYLGKTDLPRANSSKICLGKFISGFVQYLGKNSGKVTLLILAHAS